jgi:hypothetical protein
MATATPSPLLSLRPVYDFILVYTLEDNPNDREFKAEAREWFDTLFADHQVIKVITFKEGATRIIHGRLPAQFSEKFSRAVLQEVYQHPAQTCRRAKCGSLSDFILRADFPSQASLSCLLRMTLSS